MADSRRDGGAASEPGSDSGRVTSRRVEYWRRSGLLRPGRGELTRARAIAALRRAGLSPRRVRAVADRLLTLIDGTATSGPDAAGGARLRFAVHGQEIFTQRDDGPWEGDSAPGQLILDHIVPLVPIDELTVGRLPGGAPAAGAGRPVPSAPDTGASRRRRPVAALTDREAIRRYIAGEQIAEEQIAREELAAREPQADARPGEGRESS